MFNPSFIFVFQLSTCKMVKYGITPFSKPSHQLLIIYQYFHGKCSHELHSLVPTVDTFTAETYHVTSTESKYHHFVCVPKVRTKFYIDNFSHLWRESIFMKETTMHSGSLRSETSKNSLIWLDGLRMEWSSSQYLNSLAGTKIK